MSAKVWFALLARNRFAISLSRTPLVFGASCASIVNTLLNAVQFVIYQRRIAKTDIEKSPIFIIGHWRSGTTYLHELMALDPNLCAPTTYECFAPKHFLISAWFFTRLGWMLPKVRPMDDMPLGWHLPQEDEFALMTMGVGSFYETMAFPNRRPIRAEFLNLTELSAPELKAWKSALLTFLRSISLRSSKRNDRRGPQRLVLKSPPHTARLKMLRELFPDACFVHIVRNPFDIFASSVRLWKILYDVQGLQQPTLEDAAGAVPSVEDHVLDTFERLYQDFIAHKAQIPGKQFCEIRYEDLVRNPVAELERIYQHLGLKGADDIPTRLVQTCRHFTPNRHQYSSATRAVVFRRWRWFFDAYGYDAREATSAANLMD
jgi:hypothetical protein